MTETKCPECGAQNPEDSKTCQKCGASLTEQVEECLDITNPDTTCKETDSSNKVLWLSVLIIIVIIIVAVLIFSLAPAPYWD